jgi:hypothetical protein
MDRSNVRPVAGLVLFDISNTVHIETPPEENSQRLHGKVAQT